MSAARSILAVFMLGVASAASAQTPYAAFATETRERATVVTVGLAVPAGTEHDQPGYEGTAWLLGNALARQASVGGDRVHASVGRSATVYTLTSTPRGWREAWRRLERTIFRDPLAGEHLEAVRSELLLQLRFRQGSPVADFEREWVTMLADPGHPWVRPAQGSPETLSLIGTFHAELLRGNRYRTDASGLAVVGPEPVTPSDAGVSTPDSVAPAVPTGVAWRVGDRTSITQEVTSAWIAVGYPAPSGAARTALEFVAHLALEALDPAPPDPDRYSVDARIIDAPGGPVLLVEAAVLPEAADRWEALILGRMSALEATPPRDEFFRWSRRRFRARRLVTDSDPEVAVARLAVDLLRDRAARSLLDEIDSLTVESVASLLRGLGETRVFRLGPDLGLQGR